MHIADIFFVLQWWLVFFAVGLLFLPFTSRIFSSFFDKGYLFSKVLGVISLSYLVFLFGTLHVLPFVQINILILIVWILVLQLLLFAKKGFGVTLRRVGVFLRQHVVIFLFEEFLFLGCLFLWSYVRAFQPDIHGLEKFMDFGFVNSILRSNYFPPRDMWYTPFPINYYYFGHLITAVLTRLSGIAPSITFNLMLATIFAFTFTLSFSIGANLVWLLGKRRGGATGGSPSSAWTEQREGSHRMGERSDRTPIFWTIRNLIGPGLLSAFLVACAGNLHTIYTLLKPYPNEFPVPPWQLAFSPLTYPNAYWYPNATRFIFHTIHEFPMYSFVVSDLHGHVLDIPMVLLTIATLLAIVSKSQIPKNIFSTLKDWNLLLLGFLLAVMYMTNAWDAIIYFILSFVILAWKTKRDIKQTGSWIIHLFIYIFTLGITYLVLSLPFSIFFQPGVLVGGIGMVCPPQFLITIGKIGPFYFEQNHCEHSPWWQLLILYGFFLFWAANFGIYLFKKYKEKVLSQTTLFIASLFGVGLFLIIVPEFVYMRDIYTTYFRANTMFKLVYQAFILLSLASGFVIIQFFQQLSEQTKPRRFISFGFSLFPLALLALVSVYPFLSTFSYYNNFQKYIGLNGLSYLSLQYPSDFAAIYFLNKNITGQPVILEAQGDSYTDYARISANTGLPTVLGWTVHEWLWRGTYNIAPPRIQDITTLYETKDRAVALKLIQKYNIKLVYIGDMERKKYTNLSVEKFYTLGKVLYQSGDTIIFSLSAE